MANVLLPGREKEFLLEYAKEMMLMGDRPGGLRRGGSMVCVPDDPETTLYQVFEVLRADARCEVHLKIGSGDLIPVEEKQQAKFSVYLTAFEGGVCQMRVESKQL